MTDDIVTRLRGQACPECGLPSTHNQFDEAADEIERLRLLLTHICDVWGSDLCSIVEEMNGFRKEIK